MAKRFAKRAASDASDASHTNPQDIFHQRRQLEDQLRVLSLERSDFALASLRGDKIAQSRIAEINTQRLQLAWQVETLTDALDAFQREARERREQEKAQNTRFEFDMYKGSLGRHLVANIADEYDRLVHMAGRHIAAREFNYAEYYLIGEAGGVTRLGGTIAGTQDDAAVAPGVAGIPMHCARALVGNPPFTPLLNTVVSHDIAEQDRPRVREERRIARNAHTDVFAKELLASITVPEVPHKLQVLVDTLRARMGTDHPR
jgi:hypothetical protein